VAGVHERGAAAGIVAAMLLGLRDVLEPVEDEIAVVVDHDGLGVDAEPITLFLHPDVPEASLVLLRPWAPHR
jgi:hypothetical protein